MIYKITTKAFQSQKGDFEIIGIALECVYLNSDKTLKKPFVEVSDSELPIEISERLTERENMLITMRQNKLNEINEARDNEIAQGVEYKDKVFQSGEKDQILLTQSVVRFSAQGKTPKGFTWIAKDNSQVEMSLNELIELGGIIGVKVNDCYKKGRELKDLALKATTQAELSAIQW